MKKKKNADVKYEILKDTSIKMYKPFQIGFN